MKKNISRERRQYIRLNSVFPVAIYLKREDSSEVRHIQAFTHDVSLGGLCLSVNDPGEDLIKIAEHGLVPFDIVIDIPLASRPVEARVRPAWHEIKKLPRHKKLLIGVSYEKIDPRDNARLVGRARRMKWLPRIAVITLIILAGLLAASFYEGYALRERNRELIARFYKAQETSDIYKRSFNKIEERYGILRIELQKNKETIERLNARIADLGTAPPEPSLAAKRAVLEEDLRNAMDEKALIEKRMAAERGKMEEAEVLLAEARQKRRELEEATVKNMYQWLQTHQNKLTGLVMSFEGDPAVKDWAFTYDQSLALQAFLIFKDTGRAVKILSFYQDKAVRKDGGFLNAYNVNSMSPAEDVVRLGPTLWIGIAAAQYTHQTGDRQFLGLAEDVAAWAISIKDREGGLKGGVDVNWYSTEHNLDAYALFNMLYELTGKDIYRKEKDDTLKWIKDNTYSKKDGSMKRGKGDATIATDTLAWAIAAIGADTLLREGMDPDGIMKFAIEHCLVTTAFKRPDGSVVEVRGFDFAKTTNAPRGGVISSEWTAQMVLAFKVMADYYGRLNEPEKAAYYMRMAEDCLAELDKMVISSPSPSGQGAGCLPYASQPGADTGHGWRTPAGAQTGSVSATAYAIFAKKDYNPLSLE